MRTSLATIRTYRAALADLSVTEQRLTKIAGRPRYGVHPLFAMVRADSAGWWLYIVNSRGPQPREWLGATSRDAHLGLATLALA